MLQNDLNLVYLHLYTAPTELENMEWKELVSPWQADGKQCVQYVLFRTFIWLAKWVSVQVKLDHIKAS